MNEPISQVASDGDESVTLTVAVPRTLRGKVKAWAAMHDLTMEEAVVRALDRAYGEVQLATKEQP